MFHLDLPNVYKVLNNREFQSNEKLVSNEGGDTGDPTSTKENGKNDTIVVVSIFGSSLYQVVRGSRFKRAFQLALDGFGTLALLNENSCTGSKAKQKGASAEEVSREDEHAKRGNRECPRGEDEAISNTGRDHYEESEGETQQKVNNVIPTSEDVSTGGILEGFYNEDESVLFLHIEGFAYDAAACMEACQELHASMKQSGFLSVWSSFNTAYCKWLMLLFSLSHIMIVSETGGSFDTSYVSLFRALDAVRQETLSSLSRLLSTIEGLPKQWVDHARLCSPRLLFLFEVESDSPSKFQSISSLTPCPLKQRRDMLQNEIYQIFRKCRIITNISANSLFAIPATDDFVYIFDKSAQNTHSVSESLSYSYLNFIGAASKKSRTMTPHASRSSSNTSLPVKMSFRSHQDSLTYTDTVNTFRSFLLDHISTALDKGFEDDYRRVSGSKHFFVRPTLAQWKAAYEKLLKQLVQTEPSTKRINEAYGQMQKFINIDLEYLEIQCSELFPKVFAAYQRGLPEFYTAQQHQAKLTYAVNVFLNISRGPGVLPWLKKLASKCERYWKNGRQQCETLSLLGHACVNPVHRVRRKDHLEIIPLPNNLDTELAEMSHSSASRLVSYCNCGKRQGSREEPFTVREGNYDFYRKLGQDCCEKLESFQFSIFTPPQEKSDELSLQEMLAILQRKSESLTTILTNDEEKSPHSFELASQELAEVFEAELRQENGLEDESDDSEEEAGIDDTNNENQLPHGVPSKTKTEMGFISEGQLSNFKRSSSTVEYLPGMFHSKSPPGLLTLFPSWSLVCLGPSSLYSHSHGVHQPSFVSGTSGLLPWEVKVKAEKGVTFVPPQRVMRGRKNTRHKLAPSSILPRDEFSVKVFFGFEYECRKGHRFFCDSDNVLYALNYSAVSQKNIASKVIASDMPLYINCPCKESRDARQIAQLLRIHVVTPKAPVFVTINPKVQPGPAGTCPIFSTNEGSIKLTPSTYWVLRLPFSYVSDVVYVPPIDVNRYNGRLLKGTLNVISMNPSETEEWERQSQNRV